MALMKRKHILIIALLFLTSLLVRLPNLDRPLYKHHEWLTATVLRTLQIWEEGGALEHKFLPVMTYPNGADRNIGDFAATSRDAGGNCYYLSYPPFARIFPYLIFKPLGIHPDVLPLQILNLICHFMSAFFVYFILILMLDKESSGLPALFGFAVYLFSPETMWFQSNVYMSEILAQLFFIMGAYFFLKLDAGRGGKADYFLFGLANFLLNYTEWLGVFFALSASLYALKNFRRKEMRIILAIIAATTLIPLALTLWQYASISGLDAFLGPALEKFKFRSGFASDSFISRTEPGAWDIRSLEAWGTLLSYYFFYGYFPFLFLFMILFLLVVKEKGLHSISKCNRSNFKGRFIAQTFSGPCVD